MGGIMPENVLETLQRLIQDVIAPDVREIKVRMESLEKQSEIQFKAILSAIAESKAQSELSTLQAVSALRERVAVLESQRH
jgi:hypothetical protein